MNDSMKVLKADYLVVGAGVTGISFIDELIHNTTDITVIIVDKRAKPGGHWRLIHLATRPC